MTTSDEKPQAKICASCGNNFGCGAALESCWCSDVSLSPGAADVLSAGYKDCLCPRCLGSLASEPFALVTYPDGSLEIVAGASRVDTQNYHEGMFDFYDDRGTLLKQIGMGANIDWDIIEPVPK